MICRRTAVSICAIVTFRASKYSRLPNKKMEALHSTTFVDDLLTPVKLFCDHRY